MKVLALEAGPQRSKEDYRLDEISESVFQRARLGPKFNQELQTWRRAEGEPTRPAIYSLGKMNNGVGGTVVYSAWLRRYMPGDFQIRTNTIERYGEEAIPKGSSMVDWPIGYDDIEPYYTAVEKMIGVAGIPGNIKGEPVKGGNPYEGYRSEGYPLPPLRSAGLSRAFPPGLRGARLPSLSGSRRHQLGPARRPAGLHLLRLQCVLRLPHRRQVDRRPDLREEGGGDRQSRDPHRSRGCCASPPTPGAMPTASTSSMPKARSATLEAPIVVLAAYTFENVRLLLLSQTDKSPDGLANRHGQVGKYFTPKQLPRTLGILPGRTVNRFTGPSAQGMLIDDFLSRQFRSHRPRLHPRRLARRDPADPAHPDGQGHAAARRAELGTGATRNICSRTGTAISRSRRSPRA